MSKTIFRIPPFRVAKRFLTAADVPLTDWSLPKFKIPDYWAKTQGQNVRVAVLDTGCDLGHPDLADSIDAHQDFTGSAAGPQDLFGHGTHCCGTVAARGTFRGMAPACRLLIGKVLGDDGSGQGDWIAAGLDWACDSGADIISMSFGSPVSDPQIYAAIQRAYAKGVLLICAAGNDGSNPFGRDAVDYPGRYAETIAIAAFDQNGQLANFSSVGPEVDFAAPGVGILSTYLNGGYATLDGTSMATPHAAGLFALRHVLAGKEGTDAARADVKKAATQAHDDGMGWGLWPVDALLTVDQQAGAPSAPTPPAPVPILPTSTVQLGGQTFFIADNAVGMYR